MRIDLDTLGVKMPLNVERVRRVFVQVESIGDSASTAVLEVKRAFGDQSPSASFSTVQTVDLTGASVLEIDVVDTGWLHFVCTTAEAGVAVEIGTMEVGSMTGWTMREMITVDAEGVRSAINAQAAYKSMVLAEPLATNTSAVEIRHAIDPAFQAVAFNVAADLTIDGATITSIETDNAAYLMPVCETSQAGQSLVLWWYLRSEVMGEATKDFWTEAAAGRVPGYSTGNKFGRNPDIDTGTLPEDIWSEGGVYTGFPTTGLAETVDVVSASVNDTAAGTGAQKVTLYGLDGDYLEQEEEITMNGTTAVTSTKTWWRLNRVRVTQAGSSEHNEGKITVNHTTTTANVFATVDAEASQTSILAFSVPANKKLVALNVHIAIDRASGSGVESSLTLRVRDNAVGTVRILDYYFVTEGEHFHEEYHSTKIIDEKSDIWIRADDVSASNTIIVGSLQYRLVPK